MHDAVVVGAGIAGCSAAIHLARAGRTVLLLEQRPAPRRKACGEGVLPRGMRELDRLGLSEAARGAGAILDRVRFEAGGHTVEASLGGGMGIRRPILDCMLLGAARASGVEIRANATVTGLRIAGGRVGAVQTRNGLHPAKAVIAADGIHSRLRRIARLDSPHIGTRYGVTIHATGLATDPGAVRVMFAAGGEVYLTPTGGGVTNVAILLHKQALLGAGRDHTAFVSNVLTSRGFPDARFVDEPLVAGPFGRGSRRAWRANLLLAGDAAGFLDGITGDGISFALASGRHAAEAAEQYLRSGGYDPFRRYERQRRALARNADILGRLSLLLGRNPHLAAMAVGNLSHRPETFQRLVGVSSGDHGWSSLRLRDIAALAAGV